MLRLTRMTRMSGVDWELLTGMPATAFAGGIQVAGSVAVELKKIGVAVRLVLKKEQFVPTK